MGQQIDLSVFTCAGPWQSAVHSTPLWRRVGRRIVQKPSKPIRIALNPPPLLMPGQAQGFLLHSPTSCSAIRVHEFRHNSEDDDENVGASRERVGTYGSKQSKRRRREQQHAADSPSSSQTRVVLRDQVVTMRVGQTCFMHTMPAALAEMAEADGTLSQSQTFESDAPREFKVAAFCGVLEYAKVNLSTPAHDNAHAAAMVEI